MQNIALQITLNGIPQAVANLDELELKLKEARVELNQLAVGSDAFKKLSAEIRTAESTLKNFKKQSEGKDIEATLGDIGKLGGAIGASFAAATAAFQLFGKESEEATQAVAAAQNALTIALAARSAGEGLVVVRTIATTIATKAQTAATTASTAATRTFYKVLAANPYGALVAAIGLLVGALVLLTKEQGESEKQAEAAAKAQEAYNDAVVTAGLNAKITADNVGFLVNELQNNRVKIEDILPLLQKYAAGLKNTNFETEEGQRVLNGYVTALSNVALTQDRISAKSTELTEAIKAGNQARANAIRDEIRELNIALARYSADVQRIEDEDKKRGEDRQKRLDAQADADKRRLEDLLNARKKSLEADLAFFKSLDETLQTGDEEPPILKKIRESLERTDAAIEAFVKKPFSTLFDEFVDTERLVRDPADLIDTFGVGLQTFRKELSDAARGVGGDLNEINSRFLTFLQVARDQQAITQDAFEAGVELSELYVRVDELRRKQPELTELQGFDEAFFDALRQKLIAQGTLLLDLTEEGEIVKAQTKKTLGAATADFNESQRILVKNLTKYYNENTDELKKVFGIQTDDLVILNQKAEELAKERVRIITNQVEQEVLEFQKIYSFRQQIEEGAAELQEKQTLGRIAFIAQNADLIISELQQTYDIDSAEFVKALQEKIKALIDFTDLNEEELEALSQLYLLFNKKIADGSKQPLKDLENNFEKTLSNIQNLIGQFQAAIGSLAQTFSEAQQFQIDQLEKRYQRFNESIIGDSEEANAKRLEAEKIYQAERARLEKQAAKTQLRLTLAQSIANAAQAVTAALKLGPGIGQILAGITAISTGIQVGIITQQLQAIDTYRKGGRLKQMAGGGMVFGPAHEYGGVKFQGGGIELEGNESVINRVSTVRYQDLLNQINMAGGGNPIVNNFDDSRIVEAIAKQRREPIRAYVVESDITNKQTIQRRLELLSQI